MLQQEKTENKMMEASKEKSMSGNETCNCIIGLIKNHILVLNDDMKCAKLKYADASLDKDNWRLKYKREIDCNVLQGQMDILNRLKDDIENMFSSTMVMSMTMPR